MKLTTLLGNIIALSGLIAAGYYLIVTRGRTAIPANFDPALTKLFLHIKHRRRFGAALMILIALMFFVAVTWFSNVETHQMSVFWLMLLLLLLWLIVLALLDMLAIRKLRRRISEQAGHRVRNIMKDSDQIQNEK